MDICVNFFGGEKDDFFLFLYMHIVSRYGGCCNLVLTGKQFCYKDRVIIIQSLLYIFADK